MLSSAPVSNRQFNPRTLASRSGNSTGQGGSSFEVPTLVSRSGSVRIKRNARSGKKYHWGTQL